MARYGNIVDVQPQANGAYRAHLSNGESMLVTGAPGENLYKRFGMGAQSPGALAQAPSAPSSAPEQKADWDSGLRGVINNALGGIPRAMAGAARMSVDPAAGAPPTGPAPASFARPAAPGPIAPASAQPGPAGPTEQAGPAQPTGPVSLGYTTEAVDPGSGQKVQGAAYRMPDGSIGVLRGGSKGSAGGLTALGKTAFGNMATTEGVVADQRSQEDMARESGAALAAEQAAAEQGFHEEQLVQQQLQQQQQQDENAHVEERVSKLQADYDKARDAYSSGAKPAARSPTFLEGLGVALGTFGAILGRSPNFALEIVNGKIDREVRAQEAELEIKGKVAENALGDLTRELGSLRAGKQALRQILTEQASTRMNVVAGTNKAPMIQAKAKEVAASLAGNLALQDQQRRQGNLEHVMKDRLYYKPGSSGSAGGFLLPTLGAVQDVKDLQNKGANGTPRPVQPVEVGRTEKMAAYANAVVAAGQVRKELETRGVTDKNYDNPAEGVYDRLANRDSNANLNRATEQLARGMQQALGKSDNDARLAEEAATGDGSGKGRYLAAKSAEQKMITNLRLELSTLNPENQAEVLATMPAEVRARVLAQ